jgi:hypothetical protein
MELSRSEDAYRRPDKADLPQQPGLAGCTWHQVMSALMLIRSGARSRNDILCLTLNVLDHLSIASRFCRRQSYRRSRHGDARTGQSQFCLREERSTVGNGSRRAVAKFAIKVRQPRSSPNVC